MLTIVGTSHVASGSAAHVKKLIETNKFDVIALELDKPRMDRIVKGGREATFLEIVRAVGFWGGLFGVIGRYVSKKIGAKVGTEPGIEMKTAFEEAKKRKMKIALIDQPLQITLHHFSKAFTWKEKWNLLKGAFKVTKVPKWNLNEAPDPETVKILIKKFEELSPGLAKVLIHDRNKYMARNLVRLNNHFPDSNILVIVGAGHVAGIKELLEEHNEQIKNRGSERATAFIN